MSAEDKAKNTAEKAKHIPDSAGQEPLPGA